MRRGIFVTFGLPRWRLAKHAYRPRQGLSFLGMLANITTVTSDRGDLDEGAKMAAEALLPWVQQFDGYRGIVVMSNGGRAHFLTFWEDERALQKSEFGRTQVREQMAKTAGVEIESVQAYNVIVSDGVE
jgi:hypothetical protein